MIYTLSVKDSSVEACYWN